VHTVKPSHAPSPLSFFKYTYTITFSAELQDIAFLQAYLTLLPSKRSNVNESITTILFSFEWATRSLFPHIKAIFVNILEYIPRFHLSLE